MKNLKIKTKLFTLVTFMLVGIVLIGGASLAFMANINEGSTIIAKNWMPSIIVAEELNTLTSDYRIQEFGHIIAQDSATMQKMEQEMERIEGEINAKFDEYINNLITNDQDRQLMNSAKAAWGEYLKGHDQMITLSRNNETDKAMEIIMGSSKELFDTASNSFLQTVEFNTEGGEQASLDGDDLYASAQKLTVGLLVLFVIVAVLGSVVIVSSITKPVKEIDHVAKKIASGNLNEKITYKSKDEFGVLAVNFNQTVTRLRDYINYIDEISKVLNDIAGGNLVFELTYDYAGEFAKIKDALVHISDSLNETLSQINESADQVASGADQVSGGAQALSQGATEQASSIEELAATINDISGQVKNNADSAADASKKADMVGSEIMQSNQRMQEMVNAMGEISESSDEIGKIIKTIEDIAFQTNILALNAAVEAARAGAAGKGFAVVADEVRNLASKSSEASKNTAVLIEKSLKAVDNGSKIAGETAQSLITVVDGVKEVINTITRISNASNEQAESIVQVTQGVDQISSVVQTNSATAEESAAASEELSGQAQMLKDLISKFKLKNRTSHAAEQFYSTEYRPATEEGGKY